LWWNKAGSGLTCCPQRAAAQSARGKISRLIRKRKVAGLARVLTMLPTVLALLISIFIPAILKI
jgi:hypothetical protein